MKKILSLIVAILLLAGVLFYRTTIRERELVILSTNDMHATIDNFASLVTAVNSCRDSVATLLVDAGDRWTGNAFIDLAEGRLPIIELMNHAGYNAATLGNHEFDMGAALLQGSIDCASFPILCANMQSHREDMTTPQPMITLKTPNGIRVAIAGVVTNFDNGHPDGSNEVFEGLSFSNPFLAAEEAFKGCESADIRLLLSHMGDDMDMEFASKHDCCDIIISGHTHNVVDTLVGNTVIGQTGRKLKYIGATTVRLKGNKIASIDYRNIPLADYAQDSTTLALIDEIESDPVLGAKVGSLATPVTHIGFANLMAEAVANGTDSQIGFYHYGGVRLSDHPAGDIKLATIYNLEPFASQIHTITMTAAQLRKMIIAKFNDTNNPKESHRIDLFCTTPYDIVVDDNGEAIDVRFPRLREGVPYRVAFSDYIGKKYPSISGKNHTIHPILVTDQLLEYFRKTPNAKLNNQSLQRIIHK